MSSYLKSLIARAHGPSSRVEPRLRSIFEPAARAAPEPTSPLVGEGTDIAASTPPAAAASPSPPIPGIPRLPVTTPAPPRSPVTPVVPAVRPMPISADERGVKAPADDTTDESGGDLLLPLQAPRVESALLFPAPQPARKKDPGDPARAGPLENVSVAGNGKKGDAADGAEQPNLRSTLSEPRIESVPARAPAPPRSPKTAGTPVANRDRLQTRREDSAPPAIHVTIGRVDVRALFPSVAPTPSRPERPSPQVTLEKYLEARNGGSR